MKDRSIQFIQSLVIMDRIKVMSADVDYRKCESQAININLGN